jgi:GT2 family glycosyltransferase
MLLNNDTIVSKDLVTGLVNKFNESNDVGFVGANHYYYHDRHKIQTVGGGLIDLVHGECSAITTCGIKDEFDFLTGSCIFMSCDVLRNVGLMDEEYFMYWEDVDWSTAARKKGYKLKISNIGCIYHKEGASIKSVSRIYYHTRNRILYMKHHTTGLTYCKFMIYIVLYVLKESTFNFFKNREYSLALIRGLKDALLKII